MKGAYAAGLALAFLLALLPGSLAHAATLTFSSVTIASNDASTTLAKTGDMVTLHVTAPEPLNILTDPSRTVASSTIAGHDIFVQCTNWAGTADCLVEYTMQDSDTDGVIPFFFSAEALNGHDWGEATTTTNGSVVEFDTTAPQVDITNADAVGYALSKSISATVSDAHPDSFKEGTTTSGCNDSGIVFSDYTSGTPLTFSTTTDNGTKVCFRAVDALGHTTDNLSAALEHIGTDPNPTPADTTPPVITLVGNSTVDVIVGNSFTDPGATASDNVDGDITPSIQKSGDSVDTSHVGTYRIMYDVHDAAGNMANEVIRTVVVQDPYAPVITLNGDASMSLTAGDSFTDPGATANDPQDGDVPVTMSGSVDTANAGTYTLTYSATDSSNNTSTATRTVTVASKPVQHSSGGGGGGGGNRAGSSVVATSTLANGQVLGASTFKFLTDLKLGSTGADVTALQQILIANGYLSVAAPTGYFGLGTQAAVEAYQTAHGIAPASGYVGSLTRASLSAGTVQRGSAGGTIDRAALLLQISELMKQVAQLEAELAAMQ